MKIIEKQDVSTWSYLCSCDKCESKLEVDVSDLNYAYYEGDQRDPSYETFNVSCGVCKSKIYIPNDSIPKLIKIELKRKYQTTCSSSYWDR